MKTLCFFEHGGLEVLRYQEVPDPEPGPGEVLVRVRACALNHLDIWVRRGWPGLKLPMPHWGGADVAGVVAASGPGVDGWPAGRRVVVDPGFSTTEDEFTRRGEPSLSPGFQILGEDRRGGLAEYLAVPAANLLPMPEGLDFPAAAAPLVVATTAWRMLVKRGGLRAGESVLIVGAGGGVNTMAVQIARLAGARVYVVAGNAAKAARAKELGADEAIDRSAVDWGREVLALTGRRGADLVVDNVGEATLATSLRVTARGGRIVLVGNTSGPFSRIDTRYLFARQISLIGSHLGSRQDLLEVTGLLWSGRLQPVIDRVLPLAEGREAFAILERGGQFGKLVLTP